MDGILNVNKPMGCSSYDVLRHIKRALRASRRGTPQLKIGHAGTLDPFATGVLVVLLGQATKLSERFMNYPKIYEGTIFLGVQTYTGDLTGAVERRFTPSSVPPWEQLQGLAKKFVGTIRQAPPMYSALHWGGRRLYQLARQGVRLPLAPREVSIKEFSLLHYDYPRIRFRACVGKGTYLRSLACDFGNALGIGGHLEALCRSAVGPLRISDAYSLAGLSEYEQISQALIPLEAL